MLGDAKRAVWPSFTFGLSLVLPGHCIVVTRGAEGHGAAAADEECDGAAAHALPVDELVSMNLTVVLAPSW